MSRRKKINRRIKAKNRKKKRDSRLIAEAQRRLFEKAKNTGYGSNVKITDEPIKGQGKLSEKILALAAPLLEIVEDDIQQKKMIVLAVVAWNASLLSDFQPWTQRTHIDNLAALTRAARYLRQPIAASWLYIVPAAGIWNFIHAQSGMNKGLCQCKSMCVHG